MKGIVGDYAIRRQYAADGLTLTEAAAQLGITRSGLYQWARKHGVAFAAHQAVMPSVKLEGPRLTEEEVAARLSCYAAGMTLRQAARKLGMSVSALLKLVDQLDAHCWCLAFAPMEYARKRSGWGCEHTRLYDQADRLQVGDNVREMICDMIVGVW